MAHRGTKRKNLLVKPEGERSLGRPKFRWEDNIKKGLKEISWNGVTWIHLAQVTEKQHDLLQKIMNARIS
jgi:hypothetical protein